MSKMISMYKVLVGLSGGVDSAAAVIILKNLGYLVEGVYLHLQNDDESIAQAEEMAKYLNISLHILDLREYFEQEIISYFIKSYEKGETPNPCIRCNKQIKFGKMLDFALKSGFNYIATGHYARVVHENHSSKIFKAQNLKKDQSYLLYTLNNKQRKHLLLPLGDIESKNQTRRLLINHDIPFAEKEESQEICFVKQDYRDFLKERGFIPKYGDFVDDKGNKLGQHRGIGFYTIGQRRGLGISHTEPLFVKEVLPAERKIVLSNAKSLLKDTIYAHQIHFFESIPSDSVVAKIRYSAEPSSCRISILAEDRIKVDFDNPVRAATPGQSIVFYRDEELLGGGIICQ